MENKINYYIIGGLVLVIVGLIYFNRITSNKLATKDNALVEANDTLHKFKTTLGNQGAYISTIVSDKNNLISLLQLKTKDSIQNKTLIDSLKKDKHFQSGSVVTIEGKTKYIHDIDSSYKAINLNDTISTKWYDAGIHIHNDKLGLNLTQRDQINITNNLKSNKGLFSGNTLTTYATSSNPDMSITGLTSVSTIVDKRKVRLGTTIGPSVVINKTGTHAGIGITLGISF